MSELVSLVLQFELKYCERCGALCLRQKGDVQCYCAPCAEAESSTPRPVGHRSGRVA